MGFSLDSYLPGPQNCHTLKNLRELAHTALALMGHRRARRRAVPRFTDRTGHKAMDNTTRKPMLLLKLSG